MFYRLAPPQDAEDASVRAVATVEQAYKARKVKIGETRRKQLDTKIRRLIEQWESGTSSMRSTLKELADFLDGAEEVTDFPFGPEASSRIDIKLASAYVRSLRAQFIKSGFSDPARTYVAVPMPGVTRKEVQEVETGINWTAEYDCNFNETLKDTIIPSFRDRLALIHGHWERRLEHGCDYRTYIDVDMLRNDYPTPESADVTTEEYEEILATLAHGDEVMVEYEIDFLSKNGPEFTVFPLAKFIWAPLYAQSFEKMQLYGFKYTETPQRFDSLTKHGFYDADIAAEVKRRSQANGAVDDWDASRSQHEGVSSGSEETAYQLAYLVVSEDLDRDGIVEKYVVIWDLEKHRSLRWEPYSIRRNIPCIVGFRLVRRPDGRLLGSSMLEDAEALFREINALHRHRSNQRRLTDSVTLLFPSTLKDQVDLGAEYAYFVPGRVLYLPDQYMRSEMSPRQLIVQDTSRTQTSVDEEGLLQRYLDLILGLSQGQSGRESQQDPNAPASKTAMLLARADIRIEDMVSEWQRSIPAATDLLRALYYQNAGSTISITQGYEGEQDRFIKTSVFANPKIKAALKPIKPAISPEIEMQRISTIAVALTRFQFVVQIKPMIVLELWNDFIAASRIERPERFQVQVDPQGQANMNGQPVDLAQMIQQMAAGGMGGPGGPAQTPGGPRPGAVPPQPPRPPQPGGSVAVPPLAMPRPTTQRG